MPPKKTSAPSTKTVQKAQAKVIEDKTFGLKNKNKSKTVQKFIKGVESTVKNQGISDQRKRDLEFQKKKEEQEEEAKNALLASIYKSVETVNQREARAGEDPKSILCAYFKSGICQKGKKCKFSHDLDIELKSAKIDLYTDPREHMTEETEEVKKPTTDIVCKFFLEAVEGDKYGWLWTCPNGGKCIYRHALPPGYVLKRDISKAEDDEDMTPFEERLENERRRVLESGGGTPVTLDRFLKWKEDKRKKKEEEERKKFEESKKNKGKGHQGISGKSLFKFDPTMFEDDEDAADVDEYEIREEQVEEDGTENNNGNGKGKRVEETKEEEDPEDAENNHNNGDNNGDEDGEGEDGENGDEEDVEVNEELFEGDEDVEVPE